MMNWSYDVAWVGPGPAPAAQPAKPENSPGSRQIMANWAEISLIASSLVVIQRSNVTGTFGVYQDEIAIVDGNI